MSYHVIFEFILDHVKHFGFMPLEVEFNGEVLNWDEYQKLLTKENHLVLSREIENHGAH